MAETSSDSLNNQIRNKKRKRCINFTAHEKNVLVHLIENYHDIIASKKTDKSTLEEKDNVWKTVTAEFNSILGYDSLNNEGSQPRSGRSLKCCYENLKRKLKDSQEVVVIRKDNTEGDRSHENGINFHPRLTVSNLDETMTSNLISKLCLNIFHIL